MTAWWDALPPRVTVAPGGTADRAAAFKIWRIANAARRGGEPAPQDHEDRVRRYLDLPHAFLHLARLEGEAVGMALAMQGLADDGLGPPVPGLCHVGLVFVLPQHWGTGIGRMLVDAVLREAADRGYARVQIWTHLDNLRAQRLYVRSGFTPTGREKINDQGEAILQLAQPLEVPNDRCS